jgi:hypothetical protein
MEQNGFDMFTGAEAVGAKINAVAGEVVLPGVTHLNGVGQAAAGRDSEFGKDRMPGVAIENLE